MAENVVPIYLPQLLRGQGNIGNEEPWGDYRWLRDAHQAGPILYFLGVAPGHYIVNGPTYIADWMPRELKVRLAFGQPYQRPA